MAHENLSSLLSAPTADDNKYSRGVVGFVTGSREYAGAAVLGVTGAMRTGVGLVRYLGPAESTNLVLQSRPETVVQPGAADAWVVGSGMTTEAVTDSILQQVYAFELVVLDAAALTRVDFSRLTGRAILTPHAGELSRLLKRMGQTEASINALSPVDAAKLAAHLTGQVVLLKGHQTIIAGAGAGAFADAGADAEPVVLPPASSWLATAGTGDVLAGILGALLAVNSADVLNNRVSLAQIAELAVRVHALAAEIALQQGPPAALDIAEAVRLAVKQLAS
jgi:hydroxyethylthiazole kinase-like uncharacterized protein yjeF